LAGRERVRSSCEGDTRTEVGREEANDRREEKEITQPPARNSAAGEDRSRKMCMDGAVPVKRVWLGIAARLGLRRKTGTYACYTCMPLRLRTYSSSLASSQSSVDGRTPSPISG
jgi:hypothetical protein